MSIRFVAVEHRYRAALALDGVSLHVRRGDCYGFIGHNGAGKTTALRIALGLLRPGAGQVWIDGHDVVREPRAREAVGGLIEHPGFHDHLSGPGNLRMLAGLQGIAAADRDREVARVLGLVGLATVGEKKKCGQYSQGMRQRLGLAQALLGRPRYLLLDEPTNGLDPQGSHELQVLLQDLAGATGATILLSSHRLDEVAGLCNRIGVLQQGRLLVEAETPVLLASGRPAHRIETDDDAAAAATLTAYGIHSEPARTGGLRVDLGPGPGEPADVVTALVHAGHRVRAFTPIEVSLAEIYLEYAGGRRTGVAAAAELAPAVPSPGAGPPVAPSGRVRRRVAIRRVAGYEARRLLRPGTVFALLLPALLAPLIVYRRLAGWEAPGAELVSATGVTAFELLGRALLATLPLLAVLLAGLASQSLAGELGGGTLRNVLFRPLHRVEILAGKLIVLSCLAFCAYALLLGSAALAAGIAGDYGDLVELLATGATYPHLTAAEVWPELWPVLLSPIVPLLAFTAIGFLCGTIARTAARALTLTLGVLLVLELVRRPLGASGRDRFLPGVDLPSPLPQPTISPLDAFVQIAGGVGREPVGSSAIVPVIWFLACAASAWVVFRRRQVP